MSEEANEELFDEDDAEYSKKSEYSKPAVIQQQVQKCNELRSKEMCEGHTMHLMDKQGNVKIVDIPDGRQPYINAVKILLCNLAPELRREKGVKENVSGWIEEEENLFEKYKYKELKMIMTPDGMKIEYSGNSFLPKKGAILLEGIKRNKSAPPSPMRTPGLWDTKINAYWDELVCIYDEIFAELNILIDKCEYFKEKSSW